MLAQQTQNNNKSPQPPGQDQFGFDLFGGEEESDSESQKYS